jgi:hypothetical protein
MGPKIMSNLVLIPLYINLASRFSIAFLSHSIAELYDSSGVTSAMSPMPGSTTTLKYTHKMEICSIQKSVQRFTNVQWNQSY